MRRRYNTRICGTVVVVILFLVATSLIFSGSIFAATHTVLVESGSRTT